MLSVGYCGIDPFFFLAYMIQNELGKVSTEQAGRFQLIHNCEGNFYLNFHRTLNTKRNCTAKRPEFTYQSTTV